ncbi:MAG: ABC transporter substrate-binding protein [Candidatus Omnitrophota bacterium]|nr:ABC transporter substrate-binding protein [Candidatus Omnitrophota bacterium]
MFGKGQIFFKAIIIFCGLLLLCSSTSFAQEKIKIGIVVQNQIKPFMDAVDGIKKHLAEKGYGEDKVEFIFINSQDNTEKVIEAIAQFRSANVKLIIPTGTATTIEVLKNVHDIPVVFAVVAYEESIIEAGKKLGFGKNYTGALSSSSAERIIEVALKVNPNIKKVGMIYDPNVDNTVREKMNVEDGCRKYGIELVALPYNGASEVINTFQKMVDMGVQCVNIPKDSVQQKLLNELKPIIYANKLFSITTSELGTVSSGGAVIGLSAVPAVIGRLAGEKVVQVLKGKRPSDMPMERPKKFAIWLNMIAAKASGVNVPVSVVKLADKVITE